MLVARDPKSSISVKDNGVEAPKSAVEIERKWLIATLPPDLSSYPRVSIRQGYLPSAQDGTEERVRSRNAEFFRTFKTEGGLVRHETETPLTEEEFKSLWPETEGRRVEKERFLIPHGDVTIELDVYCGALAGLIVAEIEFESVAESRDFSPPDWFGADVTCNRRYKSKTLAVEGLP